MSSEAISQIAFFPLTIINRTSPDADAAANVLLVGCTDAFFQDVRIHWSCNRNKNQPPSNSKQVSTMTYSTKNAVMTALSITENVITSNKVWR